MADRRNNTQIFRSKVQKVIYKTLWKEGSEVKEEKRGGSETM